MPQREADDLKAWTEEELKVRVLLPWLQQHGIDPAEVSCERTFTIRLGRQEHEVARGFSRTDAGGRYDVLVRRCGRNLFIVETKAPGETITPDDIAQAASYARLVEPNIAPFCIVTNGQQTLFVDSVTKGVLSPAEARPRDAGALDDDIRNEALAILVGYSREYLVALCRGQVHSRLKPFRESADSRDRIFVDDLYVSREEVDGAAKEFLASDRTCFVLAGESGAGKTSWLCSEALRLVEEGRPVLFYQAYELERGIFAAVADDLNWGLSIHKEPDQAIKRILQVFRGEAVLLLVDGLDVLSTDLAVKVLNEFFLRAPPGGVKLLLTSKTAHLDRLRTIDAVPTRFAQELRGSSGDVVLNEMTDDVFQRAVTKYRAFYGFEGRIEQSLLDECRRGPFLLRVAFEAAAAQGWTAITHDLEPLYRAYLDNRLPRGERPASTLAILGEIANLLFELDSEVVDEPRVKAALKLRVVDEIPKALFARRVLTRVEGSDGTSRVGFAWSRLRDYVAAAHGQKWAGLSPDAFRIVVQQSTWSGVRWETLRTYYSLAKPDHKRILDEPVFANASLLVETYEASIDRNLASIKSEFEPHVAEAGRIGFVGYFAPTSEKKWIGGHGFRPLMDGSERVVLLPATAGGIAGFRQGDDEWAVRGVGTLRAGGRLGDLRDAPTIDAVIHDLIEPQLKQIVEKGLLNERHSEVLLIERVLSAWFRTDAGRRRLHQRGGGFPVRLKDVLVEVLNQLVAMRLVQERIEAGDAPGIQTGNVVAYRLGVSQADRRSIEATARKLAENSGWQVPKELRHFADERDERVASDLRALAALGKTEISRTPVELPATRLPAEEFATRVEDMVRVFLDEYRDLVRNNFPSLSAAFGLFARMPITCFVSPRPDRGVQDFEWFICESPQPPENVVVRCDASDLDFDPAKMTLRHAGKRYDVAELRGQPFGLAFRPRNPFMPFDVDREFAVVRGLVYEQIRSEIDGAVEALRTGVVSPPRRTRRIARRLQ